jgi:hypothetical protein
MRHFFSLILTWSILVGSLGVAQDAPKHTSLIQLIANPEKFEGDPVTVLGFLVMSGHHGGFVATVLYFHKEDAENLLGNSVLVVPNDQMRRDDERIDRMYVILTGTFHAVPVAGGEFTSEITDVRSCTPWSDPARPIGVNEHNKIEK